MAVQIVGARLSDLTRVVLDLGTRVSEMAWTNKVVSETAQELLVEFRDRNGQGKGKGKEVIPESEDMKEQESEGSEGEEEEEVDEDVVKGPEILTLDVDESMEAEN